MKSGRVLLVDSEQGAVHPVYALDCQHPPGDGPGRHFAAYRRSRGDELVDDLGLRQRPPWVIALWRGHHSPIGTTAALHCHGGRVEEKIVILCPLEDLVHFVVNDDLDFSLDVREFPAVHTGVGQLP
jgi:hypothetical protein